MKNSIVVASLSYYVKKFVMEYNKEEVSQDEINSIVVDFTNYYSALNHSIDPIIRTNECNFIDRELLKKCLAYTIRTYIQTDQVKKTIYRCGVNFSCDENVVYEIIRDFVTGHSKFILKNNVDSFKKKKLERRYMSREATIRNFIAVLVLDNFSPDPCDRGKVQDIVIKTGFISIETFNNLIELIQKRGHTRSFFPYMNWNLISIRKSIKEITVMEEYVQKLNLEDLISFFKENGLFRRYPL